MSRQLTVTRFFAALTIIFFRFGRSIYPLNQIGPFIFAGPVWVTFFFVLSGFVMTIAYPQVETFGYWKARLARIYPMYVLALLLFLIITTATNGWWDWHSVVLHLDLLQAWVPAEALGLNSPAWAVSVEAFLYICFPLLTM